MPQPLMTLLGRLKRISPDNFNSHVIFSLFEANTLKTRMDFMRRILPVSVFIWMFCVSYGAQAAESKIAIFAAGCFWCAEAEFEQAEGVFDVVSGYTGGQNADPTYKNHPGHYEAVKVTYDPDRVSYERLLEIFWDNHDPFDAQGQFCDKGTSYHAAIFAVNEEQRALAEASKVAFQAKTDEKVLTPVLDAAPFYEAEVYHQDFYKKDPTHYKRYKKGCGREERLNEIRDSLNK
jgi:peptide-methionine (S)-S-oxide reductase